MQNRRPTLSAAKGETVATTAGRGVAVAHIRCRFYGQCHRPTAIGDKVAATVARGVETAATVAAWWGKGGGHGSEGS